MPFADLLLQLLHLVSDFARSAAGGLLGMESWARMQLTEMGVQSSAQSVVMIVAVAMAMFIVGRLVQGVIRFAVVVALLAIAAQIVLLGNPT